MKLDAQTGKTVWIRPYVGGWLGCEETYGNGTIVSDEAGNSFVFEGLNAGFCPGEAMGTIHPRIAAYAPDGSSLWTEPWGFANWPTALADGLMNDESGQLLSVADGGVISTFTLSSDTYGTQTVRSSTGGYMVQPVDDQPGVNLVRLDGQGAFVWKQWLDGGTGSVGDSALTSRDTLLVPMTLGFATAGAVSSLLEVAADGGTSQCALGTPAIGTTYDQTALLSDGRWITVRVGPWFTIEGYQLANVAPATSGWVAPNGSTSHANRPR